MSKVIGVAIQDLRIAAGLSQRQLAQGMRVANTFVSAIERGAVMPSEARIYQIAGILGGDPRPLLALLRNTPSRPHAPRVATRAQEAHSHDLAAASV
jgi:transcriptional regulator with XRE-family HTH domain